MLSFRTDGPVLDPREFTGELAKAKPAVANTNELTTDTLAIGDKMPDGTVYAGISPETNKPMYATPADAPLLMGFDKAKEYAAELDAHGHRDWRVPTKAELNVLFNNRVAIGGFSSIGSRPAGWYWSSSQDDTWSAWDQRFSDGARCGLWKDGHCSLRCVR